MGDSRIRTGIYRGLQRWYRRTLSIGFRQFCPLCCSHIRGYSIVGRDVAVLRDQQVIGASRRPELCPVCYSIGRARAIWAYLERNPDRLREGSVVIHFAPEAGLREYFLRRRRIVYVTADLMVPGVRAKMDVTRLPLRDAVADLVVCNHVLEHVPEDRRAMKELCRVLKPGGLAVLQVPLAMNMAATREDPSIVTPEGRVEAFGQEDHVRLYGQDYVSRLEAAGFSVEACDVCGAIGAGLTMRYGLNPDERLFLCERAG